LLLVSSFSARWRTSCVLVKPEAMKPPLISLNFSCGVVYLIPAFCGKATFQPHFMRIS
jgi:hypothetical protein